MAKRQRRVIIGVLWMDTHATDDPTVRPMPMVTCGELVEDEEDFIRIRGELHADGDGRNYEAIPKGAIKEIIRIGSYLEPKAFAEYREAVE